MFEGIAIIILFCLGLAAVILGIIFILVPLLRGIGWGIANIFKGIGWLVRHIFEFIFGMIGDAVRFCGALIACVVFMPFVPLNIVIGRWSAASHFANAVKREFLLGGKCLYRVALQRPLKLIMLHGLLEGVEQRVPEAVAAAPTSDKPSKRTGQFDGYEIVGSLKSGGSGAKLYIARPDRVAANPRLRNLPELVVIKSFAITEGSTLPQIVRESRALECAKQIGLVVDHGMDDHRFFYVMPYHQGEHLGIFTRQLHGETDGRGLEVRQLHRAMHIVQNLLNTLAHYHRGGLWHKDVKPDNIIVNDDGAHLVDLGLVTPLRSAMTLTTHGTEYFRDPEMVRQALKGVKVHQVDGTRFDIYAVGAVLYFVLENTFPAHGALSRFSKKSPEALRWIVRRSMADYDKRYRSALECLADVRFVALANDPYEVKPADLPSMRSGTVEFDHTDAGDEAAHSHVAGTPQPELRVWREIDLSHSAPAGSVNLNSSNTPANHGSPPKKRSRPRLRVINWWTGAYVVDDPGTAAASVAAAAKAQASALRHQSREFRHQMQDIRAQVASGSISPRKAARLQVKEARRRAQEVQKRATAHARDLAHKRHARIGASSPHASVVWLGLISLVVVGSAGALILRVAGDRKDSLVQVVPDGAPITSTRLASGLPVIVVNELPLTDDPRVHSRINKSIEDARNRGYDIIQAEFPWSPQFIEVFNAYKLDRTGPAADQMEALLEAHNLYGVLHIYPKDRSNTVAADVLHSQQPGADARRWLAAPIEPAQGRFIVLNDLPAPHDDATRRIVQQTLDAYYARGLALISAAESSDTNLEASVRRVIPTGAADADLAKPAVHAALARHELAGLVRIVARRGDGPVAGRVMFQVVPTSAAIAQTIDNASVEAGVIAEVIAPPSPEQPTSPATPTAVSSPGASAVSTDGYPMILVMRDEPHLAPAPACRN